MIICLQLDGPKSTETVQDGDDELDFYAQANKGGSWKHFYSQSIPSWIKDLNESITFYIVSSKCK